MEPIGYHPGDILRETVRELYEDLGNIVETLTVERTVIGLFFTATKLSNGAGGLCFTPIKAIPEAVCCPSSALAMPTSGKLKDRKVIETIHDMFNGNPLKRSIGIAALNALSGICWREKQFAYEIRMGIDALDETAIPDDGYVVVVGALVPILKTLKQRAKPFGIVELDPSTLKPDELKYFIPHQLIPKKIPQADLLIITGTTLINDTLEQFLSMRKRGAQVVVVGPTASMLPDAFFRRGVGMLGGVIVTDADRVLNILAEAGSGYHFFGNGAEKILIKPARGETCAK